MTGAGGDTAVLWVGHATVMLEIDGTRVLTDPVLRNRIGPLVRIAPPVASGELGRIDAVLLSHLHADHADLPSLRKFGREVPVIAPQAAEAWLRRSGVPAACGLRRGEEVAIGRVSVHATRAVHDRGRRPLGPRAEPLGFLVRGSASAYFAGDTDLFDEMEELRGLVDVALLPVWGWGPRLGPGHLDPGRAARAAQLIAPRVAIPIHWGTFALGWPWRAPVDPQRPAREFAEQTRRQAPAVQVRMLPPGGWTEL